MGMPSPVRADRNNASTSSDSKPDLQLKENFTILYDLVFELRQGMEDLQFRMQLMDGRISTLLQLLSTFQDASPSYPAGAASEGAPSSAGDDGNVRTQSVAEVVAEQVQQEDMEAVTATGQHVHTPLGDARTAANRDECTVDDDMHLANRGTPVEEESWPGYLPGYLPDYLPGV
jgi:hypothetical protein